MAEQNEWQLDSGLADDYDYFITRAVFGFRSDYNNGQSLLLIWEGESPDEEIEYPIIWSCGTGWGTDANGSEATHEKRSRFVKTSNIGQMIDRLVNTLDVDMSQYGSPRKAETWVNLGFHLKREKVKSPRFDDESGDAPVQEKERLMPVAFLGKREGGQTSKPQIASTAAPATSAPSANGSGDLRQKLVKLAKAMDSDKWQAQALNMAGVVDDPDLLAEVLNDGEDGLYAKAKAA